MVMLALPGLLLFQNCSGQALKLRVDELQFKSENISSGNGDGYGGKIYASVDTTGQCSSTGFAIKEQFEFRAEGIVQTMENCVRLAVPLPRPDLIADRTSVDARLLIVDGKLLEERRSSWESGIAVNDFVDVFCQAVNANERYEVQLSRVSDTIILTPPPAPLASAPTDGPPLPTGAAAPTPPDLEVRVRSARVLLQKVGQNGEITILKRLQFPKIHEPVFPMMEANGTRLFHSTEDPRNPGNMFVRANINNQPVNPGAPKDFDMRLKDQSAYQAEKATCWQAH